MIRTALVAVGVLAVLGAIYLSVRGVAYLLQHGRQGRSPTVTVPTR